MDRKILVYIFGILLIIGQLGYVLYYFDFTRLAFITETSLILGQVGGVIILLQNGTLIKSKFFLVLISFTTGLSVIGAIMKIMHWPLSNILLLSGLIGTVLIYTIHFIKKEYKISLDFLKYIWVLIAYLSATFIIQHYPFREILKDVPRILFLIVYVVFVYLNYWRNTQLDKKTY